jgi:DNA-binding NarL/FixJ family response regulator
MYAPWKFCICVRSSELRYGAKATYNLFGKCAAPARRRSRCITLAKVSDAPLPQTMINVLIADDHTIMRDGLRRILEGQEDFRVVGEATDGHRVLEWVQKGGFDVLLLDLSMPGKSGVELIKQVKALAPRLPVMILTMHEEEQYAVRTIRAGASGYLTKESAATLLVEAIRRVASGRLFISPAVAEQLALNIAPPREDLPHKQLSDREFEVFRMLAAGVSVSDIAEKLHLSVKTVSTHKTRISQKLGANSLADLIKYAMTHDLQTELR